MIERIAEWLYANPKLIGAVLFLVLVTLRVWLQRSDKEKTNRKEDKMLFTPSEKGQGLIEYAMVLVLVAVIVISFLVILFPVLRHP